jgi:phospholipid/cholesterol/gamma-HCH transport system substrate-binding protein
MQAHDNRLKARVAAIFVLGAAVTLFVFLYLLVSMKGWFQSKTTYFTWLESGEGVHVGTPIEMVGIRIGSVEALELDDMNRIRTRLKVLSRFSPRIRAGSKIVLDRPFIVGDKVLHLVPGSASEPLLAEGAMIVAEEAFGLVDLLGGKKLGPYLQSMELALGEMQRLVDSLLKVKASDKLVKSLVGLPEMVANLSHASKDVSLLTAQVTSEEKLSRLVSNMVSLSDEFRKVVPALAAVTPDLPRSGRRVVEALDEAVVVLKAMQKSFLLRSSAREVREEEARENSERQPANE